MYSLCFKLQILILDLMNQKKFMNNKALLVGINAYPNPSNHLRGCINDIVDMENFIASKNKVYPKENIRTLTDARATKKGILSALNWLLLGASAGDQLLFQYSGPHIKFGYYQLKVNYLNFYCTPNCTLCKVV